MADSTRAVYRSSPPPRYLARWGLRICHGTCGLLVISLAGIPSDNDHPSACDNFDEHPGVDEREAHSHRLLQPDEGVRGVHQAGRCQLPGPGQPDDRRGGHVRSTCAGHVVELRQQCPCPVLGLRRSRRWVPLRSRSHGHPRWWENLGAKRPARGRPDGRGTGDVGLDGGVRVPVDVIGNGVSPSALGVDGRRAHLVVLFLGSAECHRQPVFGRRSTRSELAGAYQSIVRLPAVESRYQPDGSGR